MSHPRPSNEHASGACLDEAILGSPFVIQRSRLAGFCHHEALALWPALRTGTALTLAAERHNPHDAEAVAIHWRGHKLGYLPRWENLVVARLLARRRRLSARIRRLIPHADHDQRVELEILMH
ncbi:MAG: HIRAN domain-containing protein [Thiocapsa sp.]|jgi:hypothetical protein|nr:HIRAN domain-containing protein [Thiocapsa sp.]MCG6895906.1 HIRAN domain-containing protein [Thiocapsa sp.]MCG6986023.1 HIRAN domain-containing protein [Thiocapsa sp.]